MMRFGSLFAGLGGFDLAFERAEMQCAWQVEIDRDCNRVLAHHWPDVPRYEDVRTVGRANLAPVDVICGGFPCQDVSAAGRRAGLAGERSGLWYQFARIIAECTPRWVCIENVPGLLSSDRGRDMGAILWTLGQLGYGWAYRVCDAQFWGVAQRRRRVFIVGCFGDAGRAAKVLFEPESCGGDSPPRRKAGETTGPLLGSGAGTARPAGINAESDYLVWAPETAYTLAAGAGGSKPGSGRDGQDTFVVGALSAAGVGTCGADDNQAQADHLVVLPLLEVTGLRGGRGKPSGIGIGADGDPMYTLQAGMQHGVAGPEIGVRRLMPIECERLQGLPDGFTAVDGLSDSARYRMLGNAVAVPVVSWIGRRMAAAEERKRA